MATTDINVCGDRPERRHILCWQHHPPTIGTIGQIAGGGEGRLSDSFVQYRYVRRKIPQLKLVVCSTQYGLPCERGSSVEC